MEHTIDATNQKLGRVATKAASLLIGKDKTTFVKNKVIGSKVKITNASKLDINVKKMKTATFARYSGYPGGLKKPTMEEVIDKKGHKEALKVAIMGMLPKNKLRAKFILNLEITD